MEYKYQKLSERTILSLSDLLYKYFPIRFTNKEEFINWKFHQYCPLKRSVNYVAVDAAGSVIAHYGNFPIHTTYQGRVLKSMICTDMLTDTAYRGKGIISDLSALCYTDVEKENEFSFGFSNSDGIKVDKHAKNYGYHIVGPLRSYYKLTFLRKKSPYHLVGAQHFMANCTLVQDSSFISIHKSFNYLKWRYLINSEHPFMLYLIMHAQQHVGYVICKQLPNRLVIMDIIVSDVKKQLSYVLAAVHNEALRLKKKMVSLYVLDNTFWRRSLVRFGWVPKTHSGTTYYLTVKVHPLCSVAQGTLYKPGSWFLMGGDVL